jgi:hypothetical protein
MPPEISGDNGICFGVKGHIRIHRPSVVGQCSYSLFPGMFGENVY